MLPCRGDIANDARLPMLTNRRTITVEWGDCDPAGIVFFPRYFEWFDACTAALFLHAGFSKRAFLDAYGIVGFPVVDTRARFLKPSSFGDAVIVDSAVERLGRSSFDISHRLMRPEGLAVEALETRVWTTRASDAPHGLRSLPIPQEVVERLRG
jgi:4-hydroxybenzoyl-CoA thioesterase